MQVRVKNAAVVNYDGHILEVRPGIDYEGAFAQWLYDTGTDVEVTEGKPAEAPKAGDKPEKAPTVAELRKTAAGLGIDPSGLKKAELASAIEAKQAETDDDAEEADEEPGETADDVEPDDRAE